MGRGGRRGRRVVQRRDRGRRRASSRYDREAVSDQSQTATARERVRPTTLPVVVRRRTGRGRAAAAERNWPSILTGGTRSRRGLRGSQRNVRESGCGCVTAPFRWIGSRVTADCDVGQNEIKDSAAFRLQAKSSGLHTTILSRGIMNPTIRNQHKGLATIAMLKTTYDVGSDHLDMFTPFIIDTIAIAPRDVMTTQEVRDLVFDRHGLAIPDHVIGSLMKRATKRGITTRVGGRYQRKALPHVGMDVQAERSKIELQHAAVAKSLRQFSESMSLEIGSDDDALDLVMRFFNEHHVAILISDKSDQSLGQAQSLTRKETVAVARFLRDVAAKDSLLSEFVRRILEGVVLQKTLFLEDISRSERKIDDLSVFFDTGIVLRLIGVCGDAARTSVLDVIEMLKKNEVSLRVFDKTVEEVDHVLNVYEKKLSTAAGRSSLHPTEVTRYFFQNRWTPSDVAVLRSTLRIRLSKIGLTTRPEPNRVPSLTSNESTLAEKFKRDGNADLNEARIWHDVDVVAAILVLRGGHVAHSLEDARAIFVTNTLLVARKVHEWFEAENLVGIPPVVTEVALANAVWLRKPALAAADMKQHQLVALCSAALQPTRRIWTSFIGHLQRLANSGEISTDEAALAATTALTEERLVMCNDEREVDAETVAEVIERVREEAGAGAEQQRKDYEQKGAQERKDYEQRIAQEQSRVAILESKLVRLMSQQTAERDELQAEMTRRKDRMQLRLRKVSQVSAAVIFWILVLVVIGAAVLALPNVFPNAGTWHVALYPILIISGVLGLYDLIWGKHLGHHKEKLEKVLFLLLHGKE